MTLHMLHQEHDHGHEDQVNIGHGGSVRCGSLLQHVPGIEIHLSISYLQQKIFYCFAGDEYSEQLYKKNILLLQQCQQQSLNIDLTDEEEEEEKHFYFNKMENV